MKCEKCGEEFLEDYRKSKNLRLSIPRFCSRACANSRKSKKELKTIKCIDCGAERKTDIRTPNKSRCEKCKKIHLSNKCEFCGESSLVGCRRKDICSKKILISDLIEYFGLNKDKLGSIDFYEELDRIKDILKQEYVENSKSLDQIGEELNFPRSKAKNMGNIFASLGLKQEIRSISVAVANSYTTGRQDIEKSMAYKNGYHTTWDNKKIFYRSSYELNYAKKLDEQKIEYEVEKLKFVYWDSLTLKQRTAVPDFYIPSENKIVEIKSKFTYNEQNMKDKEKAYLKHGYKFELRLDLDK